MSEINVAVWGSTGHAGEELVGILNKHPNVGEITTVGRELPSDLDAIEVVFLALPHGVSGKIAGSLAKCGAKVVDLSGDLRFPSAQEYERWYPDAHPAPELLPVPYGLPEYNRDQIAGSDVVAVAGCYPTATLLGVRPLIEAGLLAYDARLIVDAQSGRSGRGKKPVPENQEGNVIPYSIGHQHRHVGEMQQFTNRHEINFNPMTVDTFRGMLVATKAELSHVGISTDTVLSVLSDRYRDAPFVQITDSEEQVTFRSAAGSDLCVIGAVADNGYVTVHSSIDNLRKGAASQAVQVFNIMHGLEETAGLTPAA